MSKVISELLGATEPAFTLALKRLEEASGLPAADIRLGVEVNDAARQKISELGLDPADTTGSELYYALLGLLDRHETHLIQRLSGDHLLDADGLVTLIRKAWEAVDTPKGCWVLKHSAVKRLLKKLPPKSVMKHLGYRSVDSMLKREHVAELYGGMRLLESRTWLNKFNQLYKSLKPSDFETRDVQLVTMSAERWGKPAVHLTQEVHHPLMHFKELGVICLLPVATPFKGIALTVLPLLFHYLNDIRLYSAFFKAQQVKPHFGEVIVQTLTEDPSGAATMAGQRIHWRVVQRYFGHPEHDHHPQIFEPHVQPEDLRWHKTEDLLCQIDPELTFWCNLDYVGALYDNRPISFNVLDVAASYANELSYHDQVVYHFRESLWNEVFLRYMGQKSLEDQILAQLDSNVMASEGM